MINCVHNSVIYKTQLTNKQLIILPSIFFNTIINLSSLL